MQNKLTVLADSSGKLLAIHMPEKRGSGAPSHATFTPSSNLVIREVEVPEHLRESGFNADTLRNYRLSVHEGGCELIFIRPTEVS